ncbi:MAG: nitrous oxide reductase accessory protein NosL [Candidatus Promineofilum sp.]|nr:nitrous oxide reductase accessory protein NosL [Promineifilum sp.]
MKFEMRHKGSIGRSGLFRPLGVVAALMALGLLMLSACGGSETYDEPPEIMLGVDVCHACNMIISEDNFASAYWTKDGEVRMFDDLGEMLRYMHHNPEEIASAWARDMHTAEWIRLEEAWIVLNAGIHTPMGTGVASVVHEDDARALAFDQDGAMVMKSDEVMKLLASGGLEIRMGGGHGGGMDGPGMDGESQESHDGMEMGDD